MNKRLALLAAPLLILSLVVWFVARAADSWRPKLVAPIQGADNMWISPDGTWLVTSDHGRASLVNLNSGRVYDAPTGSLRGRFSPDSRWLVIETSGVSRSARDIHLVQLTEPSQTRIIHVRQEFDSSGNSAPQTQAWDLHGNLQGFSLGHRQRWRPPLFQEEQLKPVKLTPSGPRAGLSAVAFSPDGSILALYWHDPGKNQVELRDVSTGKRLRRLAISGSFDDPVLTVSPNNSLLAISDYHDKLEVYDMPSGKRLWGTMGNYPSFSRDSGTALLMEFTGNSPKYILREAASGKVLRTVALPSQLELSGKMVLSPEGDYAYAQGKMGIFKLRVR